MSFPLNIYTHIVSFCTSAFTAHVFNSVEFFGFSNEQAAVLHFFDVIVRYAM